MTKTAQGFILSRHWRDQPQGLQLTFWLATCEGPVEVQPTASQAVCFVPSGVQMALPAGATRKPLALSTLEGAAVDGLYFAQQQALKSWLKQGEHASHAYEADIKPHDRFLMERFIHADMQVQGVWQRQRQGHWRVTEARCQPAPEPYSDLRVISLDIETGAGREAPLYSIAASGCGEERVFLCGRGEDRDTGAFFLSHHVDERSTLLAFFAWFQRLDPDVLIGWNVVGFDLRFLQRCAERHALALDLARGGERAAVLLPSGNGQVAVARLPGRAVLDGIDLLRAGFWPFERYSLQHVAEQLLGEGKTVQQQGGDKLAEIQRLYREDPLALATYNHWDCVLVSRIFERASLLPFALARSRMTGLAIDKLGGSVAAFDHHYLPRLHRHGHVALSLAQVAPAANSPGGYVMDSEPGLFEHVLVLDFKSLYPSIIRTFYIDPLALHVDSENPVPGYLGAKFDRDSAILPELIAELWARRDQAKAAEDAPLSQAIKIIMNSFYGVLGSSGCRFFDPRLASSITLRGHEIIQRSRQWLEAEGLCVIYGDTDSLFVRLNAEIDNPSARTQGQRLAEGLNSWWRDTLHAELKIRSHLEIEFETHYRRFLMPTLRGAEGGSKKRYAGLQHHPDGSETLVFKGLESVRTDWTPLARAFQRELYRRVFAEQPVEAFCRDTVAELYAGAHDEDLVLRKRLRKPVEHYTKNVPPHVQAAKKMRNPGRWIEYVMTTHGPEPKGGESGALNYDWYRERQLAPVADSILHFIGLDFGELCDQQLRLF